MSSHASPEAAADDHSPQDPAPALTTDFNIPRGAEDPPGPGEPPRGRLRRRLAVAAAGAAVLVGAAYGVTALVPVFSGPAPGESGTSVVVDDPAPSSENPGDDVGRPQGASAPPQRVEEPTAAPPAAQVEAPVQEAPPPSPEHERPAAEAPEPAEAPAEDSGPTYPPGVSQEDVERAWELWEEYQRSQNGG
ncbi:hypothetical protein LG943_20485 [Streptomonospora sp. S1-112]|uniref:Uncharacterized protein n=1 Tax=Streptomonospora mangrovi TaxID=2883123 RepID=A0A9X3SH36_9ACTN|nr:hypothetical protein [Streptomonospora mangrovi]MDA0566670.1 hypothetical protein [Streptomonospora mangrovi]